MGKKLQIAALTGGILATVVGTNSARFLQDIEGKVSGVRSKEATHRAIVTLEDTKIDRALPKLPEILVGAYSYLSRNPKTLDYATKGSVGLALAGMLSTYLAANRSYSNMYNKRKK